MMIYYDEITSRQPPEIIRQSVLTQVDIAPQVKPVCL